MPFEPDHPVSNWITEHSVMAFYLALIMPLQLAWGAFLGHGIWQVTSWVVTSAHLPIAFLAFAK